jgi:hypothetical protein
MLYQLSYAPDRFPLFIPGRRGLLSNAGCAHAHCRDRGGLTADEAKEGRAALGM